MTLNPYGGAKTDDKQGSSVKKWKMFAGLRRKESQRIPVREVEPPRLSDTTHAHCEIVDVRELQHRIKLRQRQLRLISDWMRRASVVAIVLSLTVALFGFSACYLCHLEYTVHKAAALQLSKQWKSQCGRRKLHRIIDGNIYEETDCYMPSISTAKWSDWSTCINGKKSRWKVMEKDKRYIIDSKYYEHHEC
ncbi:hypothetical protein Y032_0670g1376 [Ancylostoma ceylanicum]|nr:hypothetical protein Y032_0670g1376 [Ancylostoma ceylanicum]